MHPKPILNTSLPPYFRQIRLQLAREPGYPEGDLEVGYIIIAPLDSDGRIDPKSWKKHKEVCRVSRLRPDRDDDVGQLVHRPSGAWAFQYDSATKLPDEAGYHFADERFVPGEYVSIHEGRTMHTYRVASVAHL